MTKKRIGIIGGSGLYQIDGIEMLTRTKVETPFGEPSDELDIGKIGDRELVFLPRHGKGHRILPGEINYKANIWALKKLNVEWIISVSAVGSLKKELKPLDIVLVDQFIDRTKQGSKSTFFGEGIAAHIMFAHPICENLSRILYDTGKKIIKKTNIQLGGTYINIEGPAFSTRAESLLYKSWGADVIGMTNIYEARLAREAELCYASLTLITDYDSWFEENSVENVSVDIIISNLMKSVTVAKEIIKNAIQKIKDHRDCACANVLQNAVITRPEFVSSDTKNKLELLIGKYYK